MTKSKEKIPKGMYCYTKLIPFDNGMGCYVDGRCPYSKVRNFHWWDIPWVMWRNREIWKELKKIYNCKTLLGVAGAIYRTEKHNGVYKCTYCHYRDTYQGDSLLWDDIKICGVNEEDDYDV